MPADSAAVVRVAWPAALSVPNPSGRLLVLSMKLTVLPTGTGAVDVTVAVKVTDWPYESPLAGAAVTTVVVGAWPTTYPPSVPVLPVKLPSAVSV